MTAREQAEMHIFGQTVGKEIGDALIDGDVRRLTKTIQSAILAEREACARIVERYWEFGPALSPTKDEVVNLAASRLARQIRARSNPETPNKAPETPENLQASTFPASILKTCT